MQEHQGNVPEITLRPLDVSDIDDFMEWATDEKVVPFCSWEPFKSNEEGIEYITEQVLPHPWYRAICIENKPIGAIAMSFNSRPSDICRGEIAYAIGSKYWGKGIAPRAVKLAVDQVFKERPHLLRVEGLVDVENPRSQRVLEKAGFQREGVLRKYGIIKGVARDMEHQRDVPEITLRPLDVSDIDDFMVWATDEKVVRFCTWEPYKSKEEGIKFITEQVLPHPWYRAICIGNRPIGSISVSFNSRPSDRCRGEIGYVIANKYWGKGIATRAVKLAVNEVFEKWPHLLRVEGLVDAKNVSSQRVLEKAGFQKEGLLRKYLLTKGVARDTIMFSFLSSDVKSR